MYRFTNLKLIISLILSSLLAGNVVASDCYEESPNLSDLKDKYYNLNENKTLSDEDKDNLGNLYRSMEGKWKGQSVEIICKGPNSNSRKENKNSRIEADNKLNSKGDLLIKSEVFYLVSKITKNIKINLSGGSHIFDYKFVNNNNFIFSTKYRGGVTGYRRLVETIHEIKLDGNSLLLSRKYYTNGVYTGEEIWTLDQI